MVRQLAGKAKVLAVLMTSLVLLALTAGPALAHARLLSSEPKGGATVGAPPDQVVLRFNEPIEADFTQVQVTGPDGLRIDTGTPTVRGADVTQSLSPISAGGRYRVAFRVQSTDGHPVQSTFSFSLPAAAPAPQPRAAAPAPAEAPAQAAPAAAAEPDSSSAMPLILAGVAVVLLLGAAGFVARSRRTEQPG